MRDGVSALCIAALTIGVFASADSAGAATDAWVSATGIDAGDCAINAPCRSLRYALAQTSPGGTITILTSGRYGPVRITKSVHIMAEGVEAVIAGLGNCGAAVCIEAGPNDVISLRGLTIQVPLPHQAGSAGIKFATGAGLHLDKCVIGGFPTFGILLESNPASHLHVFDSKLTGAGIAVRVFAPVGPVRVVFDRIETHDGNQAFQFGAAGTGSVQAAIRDSLMASHWGYSILLAGSSTAPVNVMLDRSVVANAQVGLEVSSPGGTIRVGDSVFSGHPTTPQTYAGVLSYGTNKIVEGVDGFQFYPKIPMK